MTPDIEAAITQAAQENGIDPAFALAVAERESNGDPNASASKSIAGLFQMSGKLRQQYGVGDSSDPYTQAQGWSRFINDTKGQLTKALGRAPTNQELYLAHYFGEGRAAQMIAGSTPGNTDVRDVFTPQELAENPEIGKAGTTGALMSNIAGDITSRQAKYGADPNSNGGSPHDFSAFGTDANGEIGSLAPNFAMFGQGITTAGGAQPVDPASMPSGMDLVRQRATMEPDDEYDPDNVSAPIEPGEQMPDEQQGGTQMRNIRGVQNRPGTEVDVSKIGVKAPNNLENPALSGAGLTALPQAPTGA